MVQIVILLLFVFSLVQGAKYSYNEGSAAGCGLPIGTNYAECGPNYWHQVDGFELCENSEDSTQTPIDFSNVDMDASLEHPEFEIEDEGCEAFFAGANDHAFEVGFSEEGCSNLKLIYEGTTYTFLQFHFHSPSEHTIAGAHFSAEAHMVHKSAAGNLLVLGVMLQETVSSYTMPNNSFLDMVWGGRSIPQISINTSIELHEAVNPYKAFTPGSLSQYVYKGSLTTPPCSEGVQWLVYTEPVHVSSDDIRILRGATRAFKWGSVISSEGNDNRPVQPLNGRTVKMSSPSEEGVESDDKHAEDALIVGSVALGLFGLILLILIVYCVFIRLVVAAKGDGESESSSGGYKSPPENEKSEVDQQDQQQPHELIVVLPPQQQQHDEESATTQQQPETVAVVEVN